MTMKTTFDLPEGLVHDVKRIAKQRGTTARDIVQQALSRIVEEAKQPETFALVDMSATGWYLTAEARERTLHELVLMSYDEMP